MRESVVVTGAGGQLGRELQATAPAAMQCHWLGHEQLDIGDEPAVREQMARLRPGLVINAAAYTAVDRAESERQQAARINVDGTAHLARACRELGARLFHVSTDFVFDGRSPSPYRPDSATAPLGVYGLTKLAGEQAARRALPGLVVVRTGWVYSRYGHNFVKTMLRLMRERDELAVVSDQVGTPTWARGLAECLWRAADLSAPANCYHWSDAGVCSWYDFAVAINEEALALGLLNRPVRVRPIAGSDYPTAAARPAFSVLDKSASWRDLSMPATHWRVQLRAMLNQLSQEERTQ